ncbi:MAG: SRPBCC domain-containing protein [Alphaproteobacteria bacterium]|nr:SRPBCC domain-containing protein [Alphaproteobacteria bacterium]
MPPIERRLDLSAPPRDVYRAVTAEWSRWWAKDAEPPRAVGEQGRLSGGHPGRMTLEALALAPGERAAYRVSGCEDPSWNGSIIAFLIHRNMGGTRLTLVHERLPRPHSPGYIRAENAWTTRMASLKGYMERDAGQPA